MIYATVNMTIGDYSSTCDNKILLYRGDKNVEIRIVMKGNKFTVLDSTYAQMIIRRPSATSVFSEPAPIQNDTVVFVITEDMIDELKEIGEYTFQVRLYDDTMTARATLPPCNSALIIERPIAVEGEAAVNLAVVNDSAVMPAADVDEEEIFTEDNKYNRTIWVDGDLITDARLNKIEDALYYINENGGGGGGGATAPYISTELPETVMVGSDENFNLHLYFNSPNMGKGTLRVFINDADSMSIKIDQGDSTTVVPNNLFAKGTNRVVVYVLDRVGVMSNSLVFYIRYGSTEISSDFDPYSAYDYGANIRYYFTPTALDTSLTLTFYMSIDGQVQQGVNCTSDTRGYYTFPTNLSADSHYCEAYVVDSKGVKSNVLSFNLIILDADTLVVASDTKEVSVEEGEQVSLDYKVYMKYNTSFIANIYVDDALVNTGTCNADFNYYKTSSLTKGVHTVKLEVFDVTETHSDYITWTVAVSDSTYEMLQPVNAGAMFIGTAVNKTNTDERKQYFIGHDQEGNEVLGTLSNFAYNSESGWVNDELIISGNSHVEIPVQPLANNAKYGFTLDIEFTSKQIGVTDAEVLTLWNNETNCGVKITTEKLILQSSNGNKCDLYFTDNEKTHVMFVIDRQELKAKIYLNGVMCEAFHLNDYTVEGVAYLDDFTVNSNIILGGLNKNGYCKIRNLRVYQVALTTDEIINNFISCEIDKAKQRELSEFQKGNDLPTVYVYCDFSGLGKDDKKPCKIVYNSTNEELYGKSFNLDHKQSQLQYQGTSSMAYPIKNYRLNLRDENGDKWYYTLPTAQPECRFTLKADVMSSGHWTNTGMAKFINDKLYNYNVNDEKSMNPFKWNHVQNGGKVTDFRETISGFPCRLILVNDGETPLNTGQNEPTPGNTKDMGIFNFNNDKDNVTTLGFNSDIFPNCASYEVTANSDTSAGAFMSFDIRRIDYMMDPGWGRTNIHLDYIPVEELKLDVNNAIQSTITSKNGLIAKVYLGAYDSNLNIADIGFDGVVHDNVKYISYYLEMVNLNDETINALKKGDLSLDGRTIYLSELVYTGLDMTKLPNKGFYTVQADELAYLKESFELRHPDADDVAEDWGFMGVEEEVNVIDIWKYGGGHYTAKMSVSYFGTTDITIETETGCGVYLNYYSDIGGYIEGHGLVASGETVTIPTGMARIAFINDGNEIHESVIINGVTYKYGTELINGINAEIGDPRVEVQKVEGTGLKALIDWVDNCTDEEFVRDFEEHFHKDYTLRYFCLVTLIGAVDNLGKNMMLDTADNKIFFPRFYDIDTICSYDNSGQLKFDVDIEMEQGYWNTSSSRLWTRIRDLMHDDIVSTYNNMRQNGVSYENMMHYIYDEQIAKIPQTYYNKDYDVKYAPFADSYIGMAHGDTYEHVKRWLKQRFTFVDTLFDYAPSYNNDILTIRVNTTEEITLHLETYTPVYQHLSWYNGQMDKKKIDGKTSITFSGKVQAATDQEVLIYGGSNIKKITGIQSGNPNRLILGSATKLTELDASNCPLLSEINMNKANLSPHEYLNKVNLSNCPLLEGNLRLNNSPLIQELDIRGTKITGMNLPSSIRNLQVLRLPNTMTELTLNDAGMLHTLEFDEGVALQSISMTNCNALVNVVNFDLLQTPSIVLNNSYNTAAELYFRDTTNLSLSNMRNLERVIFTPNNEYETFELINVANAPDYKVTTFNCPKLSTFMTTAPYRESYNNCEYEIEEIVKSEFNFEVGGISSNGQNQEIPNRLRYKDYITYNGSSTAGKVRVICSNSNIGVVSRNYDSNYNFLGIGGGAWVTNGDFDVQANTKYIRISIKDINTDTIPSDEDLEGLVITIGDSTIEYKIIGTETITIIKKDYGDIQPNTTFTANSIDISNTQFTDVKLLCTTDTNTLKLPTTVKNFYCDSSFDLDTNYLEDGEYDVVHGELVEPYTTDYDGEVVRVSTEQVTIAAKDMNTTWMDEYSMSADGNVFSGGSNNCITDFIRVVPNSLISTSRANFPALVQYDINKKAIKGANWVNNVSLDVNCAYIRIYTYISDRDAGQTVTFTPYEDYTPNLIPSSADGSLIFSMYAPSNTVAPASGTWDLHGLEFDNFHTFGMNNDVKPSEDSFIKYYTDKIIAYHAFFWGSNSGSSVTTSQNDLLMIFDKLELFGEEITFTITASDNKVVQGGHFNSGWASGYSGTRGVTTFTWNTRADTPYLVAKVGTSDEVEWIQINDVRIDLSNLDIREVATTVPIVEGLLEVNALSEYNMILGDSPTSISMPARYDDYNITIKNAYIAPKTHNTMLYPLLVNEDNPITGTLDYTNYAGKHLSWSFAYTDEEHVNIIQPKDELLNSYEYKYNAFYDTEYEFDNPYEIARYTSSASGVLPGFNAEFTYTYDEIDNGDGTYTTKIYADNLDNLPIWLSYQNKTNLLSVEKLKTGVLVSAEAMFQGCSSLTSVNVSQIDVSNVGQFYRMFYGCNKLTEIQGIDNLSNGNFTNLWEMFLGCGSLTELDLSGFNTSNVTSMEGMFNGCSGLTSLNLSGFNTSKVTSMANMFANCSGLTSLDVSGFNTSKVTNMYGMFRSCSGLTSLDLSGFDTKNVTTMQNMFGSCSGLTSLDVSNFDTGKVTDMSSMFHSCNNLTSLDVSGFDTGKVTNMSSMFQNCSGLTSLDVSGFVTSKVNNMGIMFQGCSKLTSLDVSGFDTSNVTDMNYMFQNCSGLTSLDLSNFDTSKVIGMTNIFKGCSGLTSLNLSNWSLDKVNTIIPQLPVNPSTSTLYGTVIIDETKLPSGWVYDNVMVIAKYTANATGVLPSFNTEFTGYTTVETNNGDGTYTVSIATDSLDNLPTKISFTSNTNLLTVDKLNTSKVTSMFQMFRSCEKLTRMNCRLDTSGVTNEISQMFIGCSKLEYVNATNLVGSNIKYASTLFSGCTLLKQIDGLNTWDTSELTGLTAMFNSCGSLTSLSGIERWNVGKVKTMDQFVYKCTSLTGELNLSNWDISNCVNFASAFKETELTGINLTNWSPTTANTNMANMFRDSKSMTKLIAPNLVNANVNGLGYILNNCSSLTSLDVSQWDVSGSTDLSNMFSGCSKLTSLDLSNWDVSKATTLNSLLYNCSMLTDLKTNFVLNKANLGGFMYGCESLTDLSNVKLSGTVTSVSGFAFRLGVTSLDLSTLDCTYETDGMNIYTIMNSAIVEFYPPTNISQSINLRYDTKLSIDSFVRIFNNLITTTETRTIMLHSSIVNALTEDQIAIATNKGWTVTSA